MGTDHLTPPAEWVYFSSLYSKSLNVQSHMSCEFKIFKLIVSANCYRWAHSCSYGCVVHFRDVDSLADHCPSPMGNRQIVRKRCELLKNLRPQTTGEELTWDQEKKIFKMVVGKCKIIHKNQKCSFTAELDILFFWLSSIFDLCRMCTRIRRFRPSCKFQIDRITSNCEKVNHIE